MDSQIVEVEIQSVSSNPNQPRKNFPPIELSKLADTIERVGLIQPPVVRVKECGQFELISGERRFRACELLGWKTIPVMVQNALSSQFSSEAALVENIQREDLNPIEISQAIQKLMSEHGYTQEQLSKKLGIARSTLANYLRLQLLPIIIQDCLIKGQLTMGHAKALLSIEDIDNQIYLHEKILKNNLSVRQTEQWVQRFQKLKSKKLKISEKNCEFLDYLSEKLQEKFGTKVKIDGTKDKGKVVIEYFHMEDLDRLLEIVDLDLNA